MLKRFPTLRLSMAGFENKPCRNPANPCRGFVNIKRRSMNTCVKGVNIESAVLEANFSEADVLMMDDNWEILDLLKSIKQFKNPGGRSKSGMDAIRELDKIPAYT